MIEIKMKIIFVENKTNEILRLKRFPSFPCVGESFLDENLNQWQVVDIGIDLLNGKMHISIIKGKSK